MSYEEDLLYNYKDEIRNSNKRKGIERESVDMDRRQIRIVYHENPRLMVDAVVYDAETSTYEIRFIHPNHHAEVGSVADLQRDVQFDDPLLLRDWHAFMNALQMLPDQYLRSLDVIILTKTGEVMEE
jgi:hypothetical protein